MEVDATVELVSTGVSAQPEVSHASVEVSVSTAEVSIEACTETAEVSIEAIPPTVSKQVDATVFTLSKAVEALFIRGSEDAPAPISPPQPRYAIPSPYDIFLAATSALIYYPLLIPMKIIDMSMSAMHRTQQRGTQNEEFSEKSMASIESPLSHEHLDTPMEIMTVPDLEVRQ
ncbi:hypothetical protein ONZ45_g13987 [Pleurotus djamor]|nr:hypothetical protein ONZ45_g13987 [Pleurotus djamor]